MNHKTRRMTSSPFASQTPIEVPDIGGSNIRAAIKSNQPRSEVKEERINEKRSDVMLAEEPRNVGEERRKATKWFQQYYTKEML